MTYVLIHGAGDSASSWDLVVDRLRARGQDAVAVDLPCDDESAGLTEYTDAVVDAVGDRRDLVVVAQSFGGFTAPLVCDRVDVDLLVLLAAMIPAPGETGDDCWEASGLVAARSAAGASAEFSERDVFFHDVDPALAEKAVAESRDESSRAFAEPWPLSAWPDVETRYLLCRDDRMFPAEWARRHAFERLGIVADEIDGGHCAYLSRPDELAERLETYRAAATRRSRSADSRR